MEQGQQRGEVGEEGGEVGEQEGGEVGTMDRKGRLEQVMEAQLGERPGLLLSCEHFFWCLHLSIELGGTTPW